MGTYFLPANLDKREYFFPHRIGYGLKWGEQLWSRPSLGAVLLLVLHERWNGDRIRWVSDSGIQWNGGYDFRDIEETWTDVSPIVRELMRKEWGGEFVEDERFDFFRWTFLRGWND